MANEQFVSRYRKYGEEQPYWKAGIFKIRLPFVHYKWSVPEMVQAVFMCATCLGAIPVLQEVLGVEYGVALSMVIINGFFYNLHVLLGDPVVPGWITPAIPIITAWLTEGYAMGPDRTKALIAMQLILGLIFLVFGITGIGGKMVHLVPNSVKAGVLMGGGLSAIIGEMGEGGRFWTYPISITVGVLIAYFCLFSPIWANMRRKNKFIDAIGKFGMLPAIIIGVIITMIASSKMNSTFRRYSRVRCHCGLTGSQAAERILNQAGIYDVSVERVSGNLTDHYDPKNKVLRLSDATYGSDSIAAIGVAAHECGHAVQHQQGYAPLKIRGAMVPAVNLGSNLSWLFILGGVILGMNQTLLNVGILLFSLAVIFQLVTLPVEFNASSRALRILGSTGIMYEDEVGQTRKVLSAAALTYVAGAASALLSLLRLIILFGGRDND